MFLIQNYFFYENYINTFFESFLEISSLEIFQYVIYYVFIVLIITSIFSVSDLNKGIDRHVVTNQAIQSVLDLFYQVLFLLIILFFCEFSNITSSFFNLQGLMFFFCCDNYVLLVSIFVLILCISVLSLSISYMIQIEKDVIELPIFIGFALAFIFLFLSSINLLSSFIALEGLSFILYVLAALNFTSHASIESALKYFCLGGLSSGILIFGISLLYGLVGSLHFFDIRHFFFQKIICQKANIQPSVLLFLIIIQVLVFSGFLFKMSAYPFHFWTPDVYEGSPLIITAFFAIVIKFVILSFFLRLIGTVFFCFSWLTSSIFIFSAVGSLIIGAYNALKQEKIKRFLAYTSINQVGFLLIGISCNTFQGIWSSFLHLLIYTLMSLAFFSFLLSITVGFDKISLIYIKDLKDLGKKNPLIGLFLTVILFSMAGIPPLGGFFGKYYLLLSATEVKNYALVILALFVNVISTFYYIRLIKMIWFGTVSKRNRFQVYENSNIFYTIIFFTVFLLCITIYFLPHIIFFCKFLTKSLLIPIS